MTSEASPPSSCSGQARPGRSLDSFVTKLAKRLSPKSPLTKALLALVDDRIDVKLCPICRSGNAEVRREIPSEGVEFRDVPALLMRIHSFECKTCRWTYMGFLATDKSLSKAIDSLVDVLRRGIDLEAGIDESVDYTLLEITLFLAYHRLFQRLFIEHGMEELVRDAVLAFGKTDADVVAPVSTSTSPKRGPLKSWIIRNVQAIRRHTPRVRKKTRPSITSPRDTGLREEDVDGLFARLNLDPSETPAMVLAAHALRVLRPPTDDPVEFYFAQLERWLGMLPHEPQILEAVIQLAFPVYMDAKGRGLDLLALSRVIRIFEAHSGRIFPNSALPQLLRATATLCYAEYERVFHSTRLRQSAPQLWQRHVDMGHISEIDRKLYMEMIKIAGVCGAIARLEGHILKIPWYRRAATRIVGLVPCVRPLPPPSGITTTAEVLKELSTMADLEVTLGIRALQKVLEDPNSTFKGVDVSTSGDVLAVKKFIDKCLKMDEENIDRGQEPSLREKYAESRRDILQLESLDLKRRQSSGQYSLSSLIGSSVDSAESQPRVHFPEPEVFVTSCQASHDGSPPVMPIALPSGEAPPPGEGHIHGYPLVPVPEPSIAAPPPSSIIDASLPLLAPPFATNVPAPASPWAFIIPRSESPTSLYTSKPADNSTSLSPSMATRVISPAPDIRPTGFPRRAPRDMLPRRSCPV